VNASIARRADGAALTAAAERPDRAVQVDGYRVIAEGEKCREGMMTVAVTTRVGVDPAKFPGRAVPATATTSASKRMSRRACCAPATSSDDGRAGD
jgi:hypothetical protein